MSPRASRQGSTWLPRAVVVTTASVLGVMLLLVVRSCATGTAARPSFDVTFDASTLGAGGGQFCDGFRTYLKETIGISALAGSTSSGPERRTIAKNFFEHAERSTAELQKLAPPELQVEMRSLNEGSVILLKALRQVDYDVTRLDVSVLEKLAYLDDGAPLGGSDVDQYVDRTCHIDMAAFGRSVRVS